MKITVSKKILMNRLEKVYNDFVEELDIKSKLKNITVNTDYPRLNAESLEEFMHHVRDNINSQMKQIGIDCILLDINFIHVYFTKIYSEFSHIGKKKNKYSNLGWKCRIEFKYSNDNNPSLGYDILKINGLNKRGNDVVLFLNDFPKILEKYKRYDALNKSKKLFDIKIGNKCEKAIDKNIDVVSHRKSIEELNEIINSLEKAKRDSVNLVLNKRNDITEDIILKNKFKEIEEFNSVKTMFTN